MANHMKMVKGFSRSQQSKGSEQYALLHLSSDRIHNYIINNFRICLTSPSTGFANINIAVIQDSKKLKWHCD